MQHLEGLKNRTATDWLRSVAAMEDITHANMNTSRTDSRTQRLLATQEVLLEYSLVIVVLGCFVLLSLSIKLVREVTSSEDDLNWVWKNSKTLLTQPRLFGIDLEKEIQTNKQSLSTGNKEKNAFWQCAKQVTFLELFGIVYSSVSPNKRSQAF